MHAVSEAVPAWTVGEITVRRIDETALPAPTGRWLLPDATPDVLAQAPWLRPDFADRNGDLRLATHSFALEVQGIRLLVDTGIGNGKPRTNPAWDHLDTDYLRRLTAAASPRRRWTWSSSPICTPITSAGTPSPTRTAGSPPSPAPAT